MRNLTIISFFTIMVMIQVILTLEKRDVSTFSNYDEIVQTYINLDLSANFNSKTLSGSIMIEFLCLKNELRIISLDS